MAILGQVPFGIGGNQQAGGLTSTESVSLTVRTEKAEAYKENGEYCSVNYYNPHGEFSCVGYGLHAASVLMASFTTGDEATRGTGGLDPDTFINGSASLKIYINNITKEEANEEFVKTTITGTFFNGVNE